MNVGQLMAELEQLGTAQNRKVYARHGAPDNQFGVSFAHLNQLKKRIQTDQALADALWATGNADARVLACMVADPASFDRARFDAWVSEVDYYVLAGALTGVAAGSPLATELAAAWIESDREFVAATGWDIVCHLATHGEPDPSWMSRLIDRIEADIHRAPNRTRHSMNMALIAIGGGHPALEARALAAAATIGKVEVDHGQTSCKTPDAAGYIARMAARRNRVGGGGKKTVRVRA